MCISSLLMGLTTKWRRNSLEPQKFPSKWKLIKAEVCFAGIAVIALIETIVGAILLTFSGFISIVDIRPHVWIKFCFKTSCIALKWSVADLVLNFTEPNIHYNPFKIMIFSEGFLENFS